MMFLNKMRIRRGFDPLSIPAYVRGAERLLVDYDEDIVEAAIRMAARTSPLPWGLPYVRKCAEEVVCWETQHGWGTGVARERGRK